MLPYYKIYCFGTGLIPDYYPRMVAPTSELLRYSLNEWLLQANILAVNATTPRLMNLARIWGP